MYKTEYEVNEFVCSAANLYCKGKVSTYVHEAHREWKPYLRCEKHAEQLVEGWVRV